MDCALYGMPQRADKLCLEQTKASFGSWRKAHGSMATSTTAPRPCFASTRSSNRTWSGRRPDRHRPRSHSRIAIVATPCRDNQRQTGLDVEAEVQHIAFLHDVILTFQA